MRVLLTTRGSSGHVLPLAPFGHACRRAGHEVLVAAQRQHAANVARAGLASALVGDPPPEEWMALMAPFPQLGIDESNALMIGRFFADIDVRAALPGLRTVVEDFRPDVIVRESWEFGSALVAELNDIPIVRVGLGLAAVEELSVRHAAPAVDERRIALGLPPDPAGDRLRETPYLTMVPEALDDIAATAPGRTHRYSAGALGSMDAEVPPLGDWFAGNDDPLVYMSFGSVAGGAHLPYFPALYQAAIAALAPLPIRLLVTIGDGPDPADLGPLPANVHAERWVAQDAVAPHAAAIVGHGGYGSMLGALRHGVPLVVLPLFSADQWANAAAVQRTGAGIALDPDRATRRSLGLPGDDVVGGLAPAVRDLLADPSYTRAAAQIAQASAVLPSVDEAVEVLRGYAT
ncbi:MAG: hypothetical protein QOH00_1269 [Gaiellales bacterium]|jgi:UDP:flavonoid glycosyltransferase YjiC (YdhE family)|nr:hypothetical protein [Gaiellales bacterium]